MKKILLVSAAFLTLVSCTKSDSVTVVDNQVKGIKDYSYKRIMEFSLDSTIAHINLVFVSDSKFVYNNTIFSPSDTFNQVLDKNYRYNLDETGSILTLSDSTRSNHIYYKFSEDSLVEFNVTGTDTQLVDLPLYYRVK